MLIYDCLMDVHDKKTRSFNMSQIRGKDTKPEMLVRKYIHSRGFRFKLHDKNLQGKPDIVLPKYKKVIQVQGCFWHGHEGCRYFVVPKTRTDWWLEKISKNKLNDENNEKKLKNSGWKTIIVWECELKNGRTKNTLNHLLEKIINE